MKVIYTIISALFLFTACQGPTYFVEHGDYDAAFNLYCDRLKGPSLAYLNRKNRKGAAEAYARAQQRDSVELVTLAEEGKMENWPEINALHRKIRTRQQRMKSVDVSTETTFLPGIDSLESDSRKKAAAYLYSHAQNLLASTDSSGQRRPAREAYYVLLDLKTNYFPYWENANALMDSAYREGKAHVLLEKNTLPNVADGKDFWDSFHPSENFLQNEWLICYTQPDARPVFDYRVKCTLTALYVGSESNCRTERVETKEVEDGYDEVLDSSGRVISRTVRYKTECKTITTYSASRSADASVLLELFDGHTGQLLQSKTIQDTYSYSDSSEMFSVSAPSYWTMIDRVYNNIEVDLYWMLRKWLKPVRTTSSTDLPMVTRGH